ncbi:MAG TPA: hypothetical protein DEP84_13070 [Chloroflexi bacterium]|nr:hypothetical protein [Chloroflexota bacterium]
MRFLFLDRILEVERGKRLLATKTASIMDEYFTMHYARQPLMPAALVIECLAQAGGWLNIISRDFRVRTVLGLLEEAQIRRPVRAGDLLIVEAQMMYMHVDGATLRGEVRVDSEVVATVGRLVFANETVQDVAFAERQREHFHYVAGGYRLSQD